MVAGAFATAASFKFIPRRGSRREQVPAIMVRSQPERACLQLPGSAPRLRLDLVKFDLGTFEFIVEQPHRIENFTKGR